MTNRRVPHLQWSEKKQEFEAKRPALPPKMKVDIKILTNVHEMYHEFNKDHISNKTVQVEALADTGCQTCTAGTDLLKQLKIDASVLVPSCHRIVGITDTSLDLLGALMLEIHFLNQVTYQMVHISNNTCGLMAILKMCKVWPWWTLSIRNSP